MARANPRLNLDAAWSPGMTPEVYAKMHAAGILYGNPNSIHEPGQAARRGIAQSSQTIAAWAGLACAQVTLAGSLWEAHLSVLRTASPQHVVWLGQPARAHALAQACAQGGLTLTVVTPEQAAARWPDTPTFAVAPGLVVVDAADPWTGALGPVQQSAAWAASFGCPWILHAGVAAAYLPKLAVGPMAPCAVILDAAPLGGPAPWVAVVHQRGFMPAPLWPQSAAADAQRPGTAPRDGSAAFAASIIQAQAHLAATSALAAQRDALDGWAQTHFAATVCANQAPRLPHVTCWRLPKTMLTTLGNAFTQAHSTAAQPVVRDNAAYQTIGLPQGFGPRELQRLKDALTQG